jgi:uncharacterized protein YukE
MDKPRGVEMPESEVRLRGNAPAARESVALSDFFRASRTELEGLLAKSYEIQQESWRNLGSSFEELYSKLSQVLEAASTAFANETRRRAQYEVSAVLELFDVEATARLSARLDEALAKARAASEEMETSLKQAAQQRSQETLANLLTSATAELQAKADVILEGFRAELQSSLDTFKSRSANEVSDQLRETTAHLADDLRNRAEKAHEALSAQLTASGKAVMEETEKQMAALNRAALTTLRQQAETVHRRTSEFVARDLRKRLDQLADALQQLDPANTELREPAEQAGESGTERSAGQDDRPR